MTAIGRIIAVLAIATGAYAQNPAFEVASIKANKSVLGNWSFNLPDGAGGEFRLTNVPLRQWIELAFDLRDYAFSGPRWLEDEKFDLVARLPADASTRSTYAMLQTLLAERFGLRVHRRQTVMQGYSLTRIEKKEAVLKPSEDPEKSMTWSMNDGSISGHSLTMAEFADILSKSQERPVVDSTNLPGRFTIELRWTVEGAPVGDGSAASSLFSAIEEQTGLRLKAGKVPVSVLVVDDIARTPTEN